MADRRSSIQLTVSGMAELKKLNTELTNNADRMRALDQVYKTVTPALSRMETSFEAASRAANDYTKAIVAQIVELRNLQSVMDRVATASKNAFSTLNTQMSTNRDRVAQVTDNYAKLEATLASLQGKLAQATAASGATSSALAAQAAEIKNLRAEIDKYVTSSKQAAQLSPVKNQIQSTTKSANDLQRALGSIGTMLSYRAITMAISAITNTIHQATEAWKEYEKQTARTTRLIGTDKAPYVTAGITEGAVLSGLPTDEAIKQSGEAFYQLATYIPKATDLTKAFRSQMDLLVGTEADARTATRASIQVYEEFGDQIGRNIDNGERFRRVNELLVESFKASSAELGENAQALKYLAPAAKAARVENEQLFAVMTALTAQGVRGRMEGTETGSFLNRVIKSYSQDDKGIAYQGQVYHFDQIKNAEGGLDLIRTMEGIFRTHEELLKRDKDAADKYYVAIGGSAAAIRFLGGMSEDTFTRMYTQEARNKEITAGHTHEVEKLAETMRSTFGAQSSAAWTGFLSDIGKALETLAHQLGVVQMLGRIVDNQTLRRQIDTQLQERRVALTQQTPAEHLSTMLGIAKNARDFRAPGVQGTYEDLRAEGKISLKELRTTLSAPDADALLQLVPLLTQNRNAPGDVPGWQHKQQYISLFDLNRVIGQMQEQRPGFLAAEQLTMSSQMAANRRPMPVAGPGQNRPGAYKGDAVTGKPDDKETERLEREAEQKRMELLRNKQEEARNELKNANKAVKDFQDTIKDKGLTPSEFEKQFSPLAEAVGTAQKHLTDVTAQIAKINNDTATLKQIKTHGLFDETDTDDAAKENRKTYLAHKAEMTGYYAELARDRDGVQSPLARQRALEAQQAAEASQMASSGEGPELWNLKSHKSGPWKEFTDALEAVTNDLFEKDQALRKWTKETGGLMSFGDVTVPFTKKDWAQMLATRTEDQLKGVDDNSRPNFYFKSDAARTADEQNQLQSKIDILDKGLAMLGPETQANREQFKSLTDQLHEARKALQNFTDATEGKDFEKRLKRESEATADAITAVQNRSSPKGRRTEDQKFQDDIKRLADIAALRAADLQRLQALPDYAGKEEAVAEAQRRAQSAQRDYARYPAEYYSSKYSSTYAQEQQTVIGAGMELFSGKKGVGDVLKGLGDGIVKTAQEQFLKGMTDPLTHVMTSEILALTGVRDATKALKTSVDANTTAIAGDNAVSATPGNNLLDAIGGQGSGTPGMVDVMQSWMNIFSPVSTPSMPGVPNSPTAPKPGGAFLLPPTEGSGRGAGSLTPFGPAGMGMGLNVPWMGATNPNPPTGSGAQPLSTGSGKSPGSGGPTGGGAGGAPSSGNSADATYQTIAKYAGAALGAFSIFSTGQQQGTNVGNVLGGAAAGAQIGSTFGPGGAAIGAAAGGLLDVIGGLFHQSPPDPHKEYNPALYNQPSDMEYWGYRYRATGTMPTAKQMGIQLPGAPQIINLNVDGVKSSVTSAITRQMSTGQVAQSNANISYHEPI